ncbi:MAG: phosphonate ABC transporter ATP-binding protein, partial [Rikenellaceae bacterium]
LIIADEPTANLDPETSSDIMNIFVELSKMGCAVLLSTHDVSIIEQNPARTLRCDGGFIEEIDIFSILDIKRPDLEPFESHYIEEDIYSDEYVESN